MWEKETSVAQQAAQEAGKILNRMFGHLKQIRKKEGFELVTEADLQSEKAILAIIRDHFPQDSIITEEGGKYMNRPDRVWLIDPLDGTTNFAHSFPFFAVSIGLEVEREVVLGVVFDPYRGEHFEAVKGMGASLNKKPITVSPINTIQESLLATGFPYNINQQPKMMMALFEKMILIAQGVRRPGSAAIDLCYVAAGRFDGFWEEGLKPWDSAAGSLLVREAGGRLSTYEGNAYSPYEKSIVASNPFIHEAMLSVVG